MFNTVDLRNKLDELRMTQEEFANKIGEQQQTVSAWLTRGSIPKNKLPSVLNALGIDVKELLPVKHISDEITVKIATVTAGAANALDVTSIDEFTNDGAVTIQSKNLSYTDKNALIAITVDGKSMLPTLLPHDLVIIDMKANFYSGDDLYVFNYAGNLLVKRLQYNPAQNSFRVISDNKNYESYSINLSEDQSFFNIVGRVISTISR